MDFTANLAERTSEEAGVDERAPLFPRKAIDPDAALVEQKRRGEARAVENPGGAYGGRV